MIFKPKQVNQTLKTELTNNQNNDQNHRLENKKDFNPTTFNIIKNEIRMKYVSIGFWIIIFIMSLVGIAYNALIHLNTDSIGVGFYFLFAVPTFISLFYLVKNIVKVLQWKKIKRKYQNNFTQEDVSSSPIFAELYRYLVLKRLRFTWFIIFFFTYFGLFNLLVLLLKDQVIEVGNVISSSQDRSGFNIHFIIDFSKIFNEWFKNTNLLLIINLLIMSSTLTFYLFTLFFDKKRANDIIDNFGSNQTAVQLQNVVEERRVQENKTWIKTYFIIFALIILFPFVLFIYLIYRGIIRRKK